MEHHLGVFECQADNDILQNPLSSTTYIELYCTYNVRALQMVTTKLRLQSTLISLHNVEFKLQDIINTAAAALLIRLYKAKTTSDHVT